MKTNDVKSRHATFGPLTKRERELVTTIAKLALKTLPIGGTLRDIEMDLTACHCNGHPLDFEALSVADDATFGHDVLGIRRHLNRCTGELQNFFCPRTAKPE